MSGDLILNQISKTSDRGTTRYIFERLTNGYDKAPSDPAYQQRFDKTTGKSHWTYPLRAQFTLNEVPSSISDTRLKDVCQTVLNTQNDPDPCPKATKQLVLNKLGL